MSPFVSQIARFSCRPGLLVLTLTLGLLHAPAGASAAGNAPTCSASLGEQAAGADGRFDVEAGESESLAVSCSDAEGDTISITVLEDPKHGSLTNVSISPALPGSRFASGAYRSSPTDYRGPDELTLRASDGTSNTDIPVLIDVVEPTDDPPTCSADVGSFDSADPGRYDVEAGQREEGVVSCFDEEGDDLTFSVQDGPDHGTLSELRPSFTNARAFDYTAASDYRGHDELTLRVSDGANMTDVVVPLDVVAAVDDPPSCFAGIASAELESGRYRVEAGDAEPGAIFCTDDEGEDLAFSVQDGPDHGTLSALQSPPGGGQSYRNFTYTATADYVGPDEFTIRVSDGANVVDSVVQLTVVPQENDPPSCGVSVGSSGPGLDGRYDVEAGEAEQGFVSCSDADGDELAFSVLDGPDHGTLSALSNPFPGGGSGFEARAFTYTSSPTDYRGPDELTLRVSDGTVNTDVVVLLDVIDPVNDRPSCFASLGAGFGPPPVPGGRHEVEAGDSEPGSIVCSDEESEDLTFSVSDPPDHGTIPDLSDGNSPGPYDFATFTYTPAAGYEGPDSFSLRASDGENNTDVEVLVTVTPQRNDAPQCSDFINGAPDEDGDGRAEVEAGERHSGFLSCFDDEGQPISFSVVTAPAHGTLSELRSDPDEDGGGFASFDYTPATDYRGNDTFTLRASDGTNNTDVEYPVEVVEPVNEAPQCFGQLFAEDADEDGRYEIEAGDATQGFLSCFDDEGAGLTYSVPDGPDHGTLSAPNDEEGFVSFTYTPASDYSGPDSFTLRASDGTNNADRTFEIVVGPTVNDPPECFSDDRSVRQPNSIAIAPSCRDDEGQPLTYTVTDQPDHGTLTGDGRGGGFIYQPAAGYTGPDSFSYKANDGTSDSEVVTVSITVLSADQLVLTPAQDTPEVGSTHTVLASVRGNGGEPLPGRQVRWRIAASDAGPELTGQADADASGQVQISFSRAAEGTDTLEVYVDEDRDGTRDPGEAQESATAYWRAQREVDPPVAGPPTRPNGDALNVTVGTEIDPQNPDERYFQISRSETSSQGVGPCPGGGSDSRAMNLPVTVPIDPGSGTVKAGSARMFLVAPGTGDAATPLDPPGVLAPEDVTGNSYRFLLTCVRTGDLYVRYTLVEGGTEQTFTVPVGGLTLIDPQGVVYDKTTFDQRKAAGDTDEQARTAAAISGATVTLQRKVGDAFQTLLSGDPGISPHVNPQITGADGKFQWDVSAGTYRVVVAKEGYTTVTSPGYDIPPPKLDAHIAMERTAPPDGDADGVPDASDNCPGVANQGQVNTDGANDGGDACDADDDNDTVTDASDNCQAVANQGQTNTDGATDGGDACEADDDNDGVADASDTCPTTAAATANGCPPSGGGSGSGGGGDQPQSCESLTGRARAKCQLDQQIARKCGAAKGNRKKTCARRLKARAKCKTLKGKKKNACIRKAKRIGRKKRKP